jgi:hypothetical protein
METSPFVLRRAWLFGRCRRADILGLLAQPALRIRRRKSLYRPSVSGRKRCIGPLAAGSFRIAGYRSLTRPAPVSSSTCSHKTPRPRRPAYSLMRGYLCSSPGLRQPPRWLSRRCREFSMPLWETRRLRSSTWGCAVASRGTGARWGRGPSSSPAFSGVCTHSAGPQ